jgi:NodT family efflux transporter outer membrane factor (OMF) lipoprotein
MMRLTQLFVFFITALLLTACVPKFQKQTLIHNSAVTKELQSDINVTRFTKEKLQSRWWKAYGDAQLDSLLNKVLQNAPRLKVLQARYAHATGVIDSLSSSELPQVSIGGEASRERYSANYIFPAPLGGGTVSLFELHTQLHYEFDFWHKRESRILAAKYAALAQAAFIDEAKLMLASGICKLYIAWDFQAQSIGILQRLKKVVARQKSVFLVQWQSGLLNATVLHDTDAQLAAIKQQIDARERVIEGLKESIGILGGFMPSYVNGLHAPTIKKGFRVPLPKKVYLSLLSHRPDIAVQKYIVLSHGEKIREAKARFYPNIDLAALVGYTTFDLGKFIDSSSFAPSVGSAFSLPLFDNGARKANLRMQVSTYNSEVYAYNGLVIKAANETVRLLKKQNQLAMQMGSLAEELSAKRQNYAIALSRFHAGLTNALPCLDAKVKILQSDLSRVALENEKALLEINLIKALGGGYKKRSENAAK